MPVLSDADRDATTAALEKDRSIVWDLIGVSRQDLRAAVNAMDDYFQANQAAMNNALPAAAKADLTTKQKALLAIFVIEKRYKVDYNG